MTKCNINHINFTNQKYIHCLWCYKVTFLLLDMKRFSNVRNLFDFYFKLLSFKLQYTCVCKALNVQKYVPDRYSF